MVKLYVEGGGDTAALKAACRKGFSEFVAAAGLRDRPRIVACGTRRNAYESFCTAIAAGETAYLLVDSETPVAAAHQMGPAADWQPWRHLKARPEDGWERPAGVEERHCHLMVPCMESWLIADPGTLGRFFGQGFAPGALPRAPTVEGVGKEVLQDSLAKATKSCRTKRPYDKGEHSFRLLALVNPAEVLAASPWAKRFIDFLKAEMARR